MSVLVGRGIFAAKNFGTMLAGRVVRTFARLVRRADQRNAGEGVMPARLRESDKGAHVFQLVDRDCHLAAQIGVVLVICFGVLGSLACSAQPPSIPPNLSARLTQPHYRFQFSEQPQCSREKCFSPDGKALAIIVDGGGEEISAIDKATGQPRPMRGDGVVVHRADGGVVRLQIHSVSNVEQENWSADGRYLIVSLIDATGHATDDDLYYYDVVTNSTLSINKLAHLPGYEEYARSLEGFVPYPSRAEWVVVRCGACESNLRLFIFDLAQRQRVRETFAPLQSTNAGQAAFREGRDDRERWESWFIGQNGAYREGAEFWASHRSDRNPPSCTSTGDVAFQAGCEEAKRRLSASDRRHRTEPDYRTGWNSLPEPNGGTSALRRGAAPAIAPFSTNPAAGQSGPAPSGIMNRPIAAAIQTLDGHFLTAVNGGGLTPEGTAANPVALGSNATTVGPWEKFSFIWVDPRQCKFALQTPRGTFVTAVHGGSAGGPNTGTSPFHTDAAIARKWEQFSFIFDADGLHVSLQTPDGRHYVTAVDGGGIGGPDVPIHTDAHQINAWEEFTLVTSAPSECSKATAVQQYLSNILPQNSTLMQPGLWNVTGTENINGRAVSISGSRCITPDMAAQITSGNSQLLLNNPVGGECRLQQQLVGNQLSVSGQCGVGSADIQMAARITFETPQHQIVDASWAGATGTQQLNMSVSVDGRLVGACQ